MSTCANKSLVANADPRETGIALVSVVMMASVAVVIVVIISMAAIGTKNNAQQRADRVLGQAPVDLAVTTYQSALNSGFVDEHNGFVLDAETMNGFLPQGATVIPNAAPYDVVDSSVPLNARVTMKVPVTTGSSTSGFAYWQLYAVVPPDWVGNDAVVHAYFRGWSGDSQGSGFTDAETVHVSFSPGRFSDYQILADGPIGFTSEVRIQGKVHSNGSSQGAPNQLWEPGYGSVYAFGSGPTCFPGSEFTTASGDVNLTGSCSAGNYTHRTDTGKPINVASVVAQKVERLEQICARGTGSGADGNTKVVCSPVAPRIGGTQPGTETYKWYGVHLTNSDVHVRGAGTRSIPLTGDGTVLLLPGTVELSGEQGDHRLTIVAYDAESATSNSGSFNGASIYLTSTRVGSNSKAASLGLVAQADIIPAISPTPGRPVNNNLKCTMSSTGAFGGNHTLHAAVTSASGGVALPPIWRSTIRPQGNVPFCNQLNIKGSIAGRFMPITKMSWPGASSLGFENRTYVYDEKFDVNPPPMYVLSRNWQYQDYRDANSQCFDAAGQLTPSGRSLQCS